MIERDWADEIEFFSSTKIKQVIKHVLQEKSPVFPPKDCIFKAFALTPLSELRVVILGQDPYPTKGVANGLAFSVEPNTPLPKSLKNIFTELRSDLGITRTRGDLTDWAEQGVLLLNTSLTVLEGKPGSHSDIGWAQLTSQVVRYISENKNNIVFILWGKHAQQKGLCIDTEKHCVIKSAHPSPLSAYNGFFGSKPFSKTNDYLVAHNIKPISW